MKRNRNKSEHGFCRSHLDQYFEKEKDEGRGAGGWERRGMTDKVSEFLQLGKACLSCFDSRYES